MELLIGITVLVAMGVLINWIDTFFQAPPHE